MLLWEEVSLQNRIRNDWNGAHGTANRHPARIKGSTSYYSWRKLASLKASRFHVDTRIVGTEGGTVFPSTVRTDIVS